MGFTAFNPSYGLPLTNEERRERNKIHHRIDYRIYGIFPQKLASGILEKISVPAMLMKYPRDAYQNAGPRDAHQNAGLRIERGHRRKA